MSFQETLGEGVAEELAEGQRQISIAEFFEKNKHMLGFDSGARGLVTAVKEGVDNALDAGEEAGIRPDIYVEIEDIGDYYKVVIEDNGPGITREEVPKVFGKLLYGSRFHKREQSLTPDQEILIKRDGNVETVSIGTLCEAYLPDETNTIQISDNIKAPSFDRSTFEISWQPITQAIRHETDGQTYEIETERGRSVEITSDHSVFTLSASGEPREVTASDLEPGDAIIAPQTIPSADDNETVNLLEHIPRNALSERRMYVYGFEKETLQKLAEGERIRKPPNPDSNRERTYFEVDGVKIMKDSLEQNYIPNGYLPASVVQDLGWEGIAAEQDCELRTYQVGGKPTGVPVSIELTDEFAKLLGYYVAEGHADQRQVGFTFGSHEETMITHTQQAIAGFGGSTTTVERERNSTRVKAFASPLSLFLEATCGNGASEKRVPPFIFDAPSNIQEQFLTAVYEGDGSDRGSGNELSHTTTSQRLARQLSILWNMQGVVASTERRTNKGGYSDDPNPTYQTKVYGEDVILGEVFDVENEVKAGEQSYKRVPTSVLDEVRAAETNRSSVPDTTAGLLMGAGVGSSIKHAEIYESVISRALDGEFVTKPRYVLNLKEMGLLDSDHQPTSDLEELWEAIHSLQGITESDICLLQVESINETDPPEYVYDISVPGATGYDENFVVANEGALCVKNSRGQQGIGISAAVLYSQLTSGKPAKITSRTQGSEQARYFELIIDTEDNEPEIRADEATTWDRPHGTRIELEMEANMRARQRLHDYIKHTAVVNPHARLELREPNAHLKFERGTDQLPAETTEIRPHPHGVELGTLLSMLEATDSYSLSGFLQGEFTRVGAKTTENIIESFMDRHVGRELSWEPPRTHEEVDIRREVQGAVANKGREATAAFADRVADVMDNRERVSHGEVVEIIDTIGDDIGQEYDTTFGSTVREKAVNAVWAAVTAELESDLYVLIDAATTDRKDDATISGVAERLAGYLTDAESQSHRFTEAELQTFVDDAADRVEEYEDATVGETARENVVEEIWSRTRPVPDEPPKVDAIAEDRDAASDLLEAMLAVDIIAPPTDCLAPITAEEIEAGLRKEFDAEFFAASSRDASVHGGDPFVVEAGIAYGGDLEDDGQVQLMRFANRVPLVYQRGACAITDTVKGINWRNYGLDQPGGSGMPNGPAVLLVSVASTNVPFTSESKDAVANVPAMEDEIELAVREAARDLKAHINKREQLQQRREKRNVLSTILPTMAEKVATVTGREPLDIDDSLARIMNNVLVEYTEIDDAPALVVENNDSTGAEPDITAILDDEPSDVSAGSVVEMDGEWFLSWEPEVAAGETVTLRFSMPEDTDVELTVDGVEDERLTVDQ